MVSRPEHRRRTLASLNRAAVEAMEEHGPDVPLDDIADRAGVSRRTIYRWVDSRDDLIFVHPRLWLEVFDEAVSRRRNAPLAERIRTGSAAVCEVIDDDPDPVVRSLFLALEHPQLLRGYTAVNQAWIDRIAIEVALDDPDDAFRARVVGAAVMGVIDAALFEWVSDPKSSLGWLIERGLDHLDPVLQHTSRPG